MASIATVGLTVSLVVEFEPESLFPTASVAETVKVTEPSDSALTSLFEKLKVPPEQVVDPEIEAGAVIAMISPLAVQVPEKL